MSQVTSAVKPRLKDLIKFTHTCYQSGSPILDLLLFSGQPQGVSHIESITVVNLGDYQ